VRTPLILYLTINTSFRTSRITLYEGRYHQIRRMLAVVNNQALTIHRIAVGPVQLKDLPSGHWRALTDDEIKALGAKKLSKAAKSVWSPLRVTASSSSQSSSSSTDEQNTTNATANKKQVNVESSNQSTRVTPSTVSQTSSPSSPKSSARDIVTPQPQRSSSSSSDIDLSQRRVANVRKKLVRRSSNSNSRM